MWINKVGAVQDHFAILGTPSNPVYLIKGDDEYALVEGGLTRDVAIVISQLKEHVSDLSLVKHWFITHSHYDHCGAVESIYPYLENVTLYASEDAVKNFRNEKYVKKIRQLNAIIFDKDIIEFPSDLQQIPFVVIKDNEPVETSIGTWEIIYTPGHSSCSTSLYHKESNILFVSDSLGEIIEEKKWFPLAFDHVGKFIDSINKLSSLKPDVIALGHNGVLTDSDAEMAVVHSLRGYDEFVKFISDLKNKLSLEQLVDMVSKKYKTMDHSFIPDNVYRKSIEVLLHNLQTEALI